jgi:hypothetical protein
MKYSLFFFCLFLVVSCNEHANNNYAPLIEGPLQLENFDFNTKVTTLLPENARSKKYKQYYEIQSEMLKVDTILDGEFIGSEKPIRIDYNQRCLSGKDIMAKFETYSFNAVNLTTTLDNTIMAINGLNTNISKSESKSFTERLNKKYGPAAKTQGKFITPFDIFTWQLKDRIIKYCIAFENGSNTIKLSDDDEDRTIKTEKAAPHYSAYIFVISKKFADQVIGKIGGGDFLYCE